jgi:GNAT superfamily N-acetyltransferase
MSNEVVFKKVTSQEEKDMFHYVKGLVWEGTGYGMEYGREGSDLYIAYVNGIPGGTFEFTPYPQFTRTFMKKLFVDTVNEHMSVVELDSFAVLPEFRGKLGREIVRFMIYYAQTNGYTHGIGISAPSVFESFNHTYHIRSEQVKEKMWYKGDDVIPTLFHLKEVYDHLDDEKYAWYVKPIELKEKEEVVA